MTSPKEYRDFAVECAKQAAETPDVRLRAILLETARVWMKAALHASFSSMWEHTNPKPKLSLVA